MTSQKHCFGNLITTVTHLLDLDVVIIEYRHGRVSVQRAIMVFKGLGLGEEIIGVIIWIVFRVLEPINIDPRRLEFVDWGSPFGLKVGDGSRLSHCTRRHLG